MAKVIALLGALFSSAIVQAREPISDAKMNKIYSEFQYRTQYELVAMDEYGNNSKNKRCYEYNFHIKTRYPGADEDVEITGRLYTPNPRKVPGVIPFVIQLPPMGGTNLLDKWMGGKLCKHNMAGFIIGTDFTGFNGKETPPVEDHDDALRRTTAAVKAAIAYAKDTPRYNGDKIGLIGVSLGGIMGSLSFSVLDEISAAYIIVAGGDTPHILAWSEQKRVRNLRNLRMKEQNLGSQVEYEAWLREHLFLDPFDVARRVPVETLFMVISSNDKNVPSEDQFLLHDGFKRPEHKVKTASHVGTIMSELLWANGRRRIAEWFEGRFALENPRRRESKSIYRSNFVENF